MKFKNRDELQNLIPYFVNCILSEDSGTNSIDFLIDINIFELPEGYTDKDSNRTIKEKLVSLIVAKRNKDKDILKLIQNLKQRKIKGFEHYLIKELLTNDRLTAAVILLNSCLEKPYWAEIFQSETPKELPEEFKELAEKIAKYIENLEPTIETLNTIALLEEKYLKSKLTKRLLEKFNQITISEILIIATIPDEKLKTQHLIKTIIDCIKKNDFSLAKAALENLANNEKKSGHLLLNL